MINKDLKESKLQPLIDRIGNIEDNYGAELYALLISRIELKLNQFFEDFEGKSSQSFKLYWDKSEELKTRLLTAKLQSQKTTTNEANKVPKFIEEFENKN